MVLLLRTDQRQDRHLTRAWRPEPAGRRPCLEMPFNAKRITSPELRKGPDSRDVAAHRRGPRALETFDGAFRAPPLNRSTLRLNGLA